MKHHIWFAFRQMKKNPGTTIVAIIILALGIGANTALFTLIDSILLRPLPYQRSESIVLINNGVQPVGVDSWLDYDDLVKRTKSYEAVAAFTVGKPVVHAANSTELVMAVRTTASVFDVLKIHPTLGRPFTTDDNRPGAVPVALVTNVFWRENLNSDPAVLGKQVTIGNTIYNIIGVLPAALKFPELWGSDAARGVWVPLQVTPNMLTQRSSKFLVMVGRLRPDIGIEAAQREALAITEALNRSIGENGGQVAFRIFPFQELVTANARPALLALTIAMALILLMACANVANLQSARFLSRRQEFALRTALGAGRRKLAGQVLAEISVLCTFGAIVGLGIAWLLLRLVALFPQDIIARADEIHFRWEVMAVLGGIAALTAVLSALVPALQTGRNSARLTVGDSLRGSSAGPVRTRTSRWLISGEVALSAILLVGAVLMLRTLAKLQDVTASYDPQRVTMFWAVPGKSSGFLQNSQNSPSAGSTLTRIYEPMLQEILRLPGVRAAAFTSAAPLNGVGTQAGFDIVGRRGKYPPVFLRAVSSEYAQVLGTPVLRGRMISDSDTPDSQFVAVVNQAFVAQFLGDTDPVGKELELAKIIGMNKPYLIVGVLANAVQNQVDHLPAPEVSIAYRQIPPESPFFPLLVAPEATYVVRTQGNIAVMPAIRSLFKSGAPDTVLNAVQTLEEAQYNNTFQHRLSFYLIAGFAAMAVLLVVAGLYGVLSQLVGQRRREIGVRMALGASRSQIVRLIAKQGLIMVAAGLGIGFLASLVFGRFIASFLYGVKPGDLLSYTAVLLILLLAGCAAIFIPTYRASRMDPADALRMD